MMRTTARNVLKPNDIIVACDSFKGSLGSSAVNEACREGILAACPHCKVTAIALADGGEGTVAAVAASVPGGVWYKVEVDNPLGTPVEAAYYAMPDGRTAVMETAAAAGLTLVNDHNPWLASTYGLGQMIADAREKGYADITVGLGGSATNDGGTGMLQALGYKFYDRDGALIADCGGRILSRIASIEAPAAGFGVSVTALCDVDNPLTGEHGATRIFGPQKGAGADMLDALEAGMCNYARVIGADVASTPGAGAAGGLGAALLAFAHAELRPGIDVILDLAGFDDKLRHADLVITGEGRLDASTLMGKAPAGILRRATKQGVPVVAIAGSVAADVDFSGFKTVAAVSPQAMPLALAMRPDIAAANISKTVSSLLL